MSCRPNTAIVHEANGRARQLVPALRTRLEFSSKSEPRTPAGWLTLAGLAKADVPRRPAAARRRLDALLEAVPALLALPGVVPLAPAGELPIMVDCPDQLLAMALLVRRSGGVWLARRTPTMAVLDREHAVITLLLPHLDITRVQAAVADPAWPHRVLEHTQRLEAAR
jgi:hypothetical protein